jgi:hypothetical protein
MKVNFSSEAGASKNSSSSSGGVGVTGLLLVAFIVLKLTGYIDWPWLWVLSPAWISCLLVVFALAVIGIIAWLNQ